MMPGNYVKAAFATPLTSPKPSNQFFPFDTYYFSQNLLTQQRAGEFKKKRSVLVVDDVSDVAEMLAVLLTSAGFEVTTVSSAPAAIAVASDRHFDIVISDIGMPQMTGYDLARALRALPSYESIPMVAVTGYSMYDDRERSLRCGFNVHLTKPIDPRALLDLIGQL